MGIGYLFFVMHASTPGNVIMVIVNALREVPCTLKTL